MPDILTASWDQHRSWMLRKWAVIIMAFIIGIAGVILVITPSVASAKMNFFGNNMDDINASMTNMLGLGDNDEDNPVTQAGEIMSGEWTDYNSQEVSGETMESAVKLIGAKKTIWGKFFWDGGTEGTQPIVQQITGAMAVFGGLLCFMYFLKAVIDEMAKGTADFDSWLKIFVKLAIAALVIANINALTTIAQGLAVSLGSLVKTIMTPIMDETRLNAMTNGAVESVDSAAHGHILSIFIAPLQILSINVLGIIIAYFACGIQNFLLYAFSYGVFYEIAIRKCFMPIAVANIFGEGFRSSGARYIKKYFATCFRIVLLLLISEMAQIVIWQMIIINPLDIAGGSFLNIANFPIVMIIAVLTSARALYGKASSLADEIVGVYD